MIDAGRRTLRLIGYWDGPRTPGWPVPQDFVDPGWDALERDLVTDYLTQGFVFRGFGGISRRRMCGQENGALELTDGTWYWPDGLAHYLRDHDVRLSQVFVDHVNAQFDRLETPDTDTEWWRNLK